MGPASPPPTTMTPLLTSSRSGTGVVEDNTAEVDDFVTVDQEGTAAAISTSDGHVVEIVRFWELQ